MMKSKLDFKAITIAYNDYLKDYKAVEGIKQQILQDNEIQNLYDIEQIREARRLTRAKYPNYSLLNSNLNNATYNLINTMIRDIPEYQNMKIERIMYIVALQDRILKLAEQVYNDYKDLYIV